MNARFALVGLLLPLVAACGGVDATQISGRHNVSLEPTVPAEEGDPTADPSAPAAGGASNGGAATDTNGGAGAAGPVNAFTGAAAFVSKLGPSTRKGEHSFAGNNPPTSPKGQACSSCHSFFMGGTVFADAAGTVPAAGVEVRARDAAGNAVSAWTDQDGNFYISRASGLTLPASVGVRDATTVKPMSATIANGTCASSACHVAGKQGGIHLP